MVAKAVSPDGDRRLSVKQIAARWSVSRSNVYALITAGRLPHLRVGLGRGTIRVRESDVEAYERERGRDDGQAFAEHFS
jgi:excisionase family DNA binding protein